MGEERKEGHKRKERRGKRRLGSAMRERVEQSYGWFTIPFSKKFPIVRRTKLPV